MDFLPNFISLSIAYCLPNASEFWTEKCNFFQVDPEIFVNNPYLGYLFSDNIELLLGLTKKQSSHYESFLYAYCLYRGNDLDSCSLILQELVPRIPTSDKPFLSAINYYLGLASPDNTKTYLIQSFELWYGNYDALHHLLHFNLVPSQEKTSLAHIISQINSDIVKDLYWCQLASNGPVLLDSMHVNMLEDDDVEEPSDNTEDDPDYQPSNTSVSMTAVTNTTSEVPITLNEVQEIVNELQMTLNTRCIQLHLKEFELLKNNIHILLYEGIRHYNFYCFYNCIKYMHLVLQQSPSHKLAQVYYLKSLLFIQDVDLLSKASNQLQKGNTLTLSEETKTFGSNLFKMDPVPKQHDVVDKPKSCNEIAWFAVGCFNLLIREFDVAINAFQQSILINNLFYEAHYCLGLTYSFISNFDKSIYEFSKYKQHANESYISYMLIGTRYLLQKKLNIAESFLLEALQRAVPEKLPMKKMVVILNAIQVNSTMIVPIGNNEDMVVDEDTNSNIMSYLTPKTHVDPSLLTSLAYLYKCSGKFDISLNYFENILKQLITRPSIGYSACECESVGLVYTNKWELTGTRSSPVIVQFIQFSFLNMADIYISKQDYKLAQYYLNNIAQLDEEYCIGNEDCLPIAFHILSYDVKNNKKFREFVLGNGMKLMGKCWYCLGDYIKSIACYEEAFEMIPNDKVIHGLYDDALIKLKENPPLDKDE